MIACISTSLLGLIVGIYVSDLSEILWNICSLLLGRRSTSHSVSTCGSTTSCYPWKRLVSFPQSYLAPRFVLIPSSMYIGIAVDRPLAPKRPVLLAAPIRTICSLKFQSTIAISTFIAWLLPLLHGHKPYILASLALALPLQLPQALVVGSPRSPKSLGYMTGLLLMRGASGLVLGLQTLVLLPLCWIFRCLNTKQESTSRTSHHK